MTIPVLKPLGLGHSLEMRSVALMHREGVKG